MGGSSEEAEGESRGRMMASEGSSSEQSFVRSDHMGFFISLVCAQGTSTSLGWGGMWWGDGHPI
jgi:hypothetical protein